LQTKKGVAPKYLVELVIGVVAIIAIIAGLVTYFPQAWAKFQEMLGWGGGGNDFQKAVKCSYYRCTEGCESTKIANLAFNTPYGDNTPCTTFCDSEWTDNGQPDGRICGWNSIQFPVELAPFSSDDEFTPQSFDPRFDCVIPTDDSHWGVPSSAVVEGLALGVCGVSLFFPPAALVACPIAGITTLINWLQGKMSWNNMILDASIIDSREKTGCEKMTFSTDEALGKFTIDSAGPIYMYYGLYTGWGMWQGTATVIAKPSYLLLEKDKESLPVVFVKAPATEEITSRKLRIVVKEGVEAVAWIEFTEVDTVSLTLKKSGSSCPSTDCETKTFDKKDIGTGGSLLLKNYLFKLTAIDSGAGSATFTITYYTTPPTPPDCSAKTTKNRCSGTALSCNSFDLNKNGCVNQAGCSWCGCWVGGIIGWCSDIERVICENPIDPLGTWRGCEGTATPCSSLTPENCASQKGCTFIQGDCEAAGCRWCDKCSGGMVNPWKTDKCVRSGDCVYSCVKGECGAECATESDCGIYDCCVDCGCVYCGTVP